MDKKTMHRVFASSGLVVLLLAACGGPKPLSEGDRAFVEQVAPITENLLTALSEGDEAAYTRDMDPTMKQASSGANFTQLYDMVMGKIGKYVSARATQVSQQDNFKIVLYDATFEQEEHVTVRIVYDVSGAQPLVSGFWLDSPKLRRR